MNNKINDWSWTDATNEEFEKNRHTKNYYRIFHKKGKKDVVDYKFWAKDDKAALKVLNEYKNEHEGEFFYSTSGYYLDSDKKRFDNMDEMMEDWKKSAYTEEDRKYDIETVNDFKKNYLSERRCNAIADIKTRIAELNEKVRIYENKASELNNMIQNTDLKSASEKDMDELKSKIYHLDDKYYEIEDAEYLIRTKHNRQEKWELYTHILDDIRYNVKIMIDNKNCGYPSYFINDAAKEMGIACDNTTHSIHDKNDEKKVSKRAAEMWKNELKNLYDSVLGYRYFSEYGYVDSKDKELVKFDKMHKSELPYKEGTDKEFDYKKLSVLTNLYWNKIWDWMKKYGANLWD